MIICVLGDMKCDLLQDQHYPRNFFDNALSSLSVHAPRPDQDCGNPNGRAVTLIAFVVFEILAKYPKFGMARPVVVLVDINDHLTVILLDLCRVFAGTGLPTKYRTFASMT